MNLVNVRTPDSVIPTIAATLGVRELVGQPLAQRLADVLRIRELLLVLDNCEHVMSAMPAIAELLALTPRLKVLATSRAVLHLSGECEFPVPPLALPNLADPHTIAAPADYAAIDLFVQRAVAVRPDFALTPTNGPAVAAICARLDGIPLAIELAAARSKLLAPPTLLERLTEAPGASLQLLSTGARDRPAHQQTLRGALDWSYQLLTEAEQTLLRRLGVFVGGCTLEGVAAIMQEPAASTSQDALQHENAGSIALLDQVGALVDKSLIGRIEAPDGDLRFTLLETIREYAIEQLTAVCEGEPTRRRHALYYLALAERAEHVLEENAQGTWPERLNAEHGNLREALAWLVSNEPQMAIRLASALWRVWMQIGYLSEGRRRLVQALEAGAGAITPARAKALRALGMLAWHQGDFRQTQIFGEQFLEAAQTLGDVPMTIRAFSLLGMRAALQGDYADAHACYDESLTLAHSIGYDMGVAVAHQLMGYLAVYEGDCAQAVTLFTEALAMVRKLGNEPRICWILGGGWAKRTTTGTTIHRPRHGLPNNWCLYAGKLKRINWRMVLRSMDWDWSRLRNKRKRRPWSISLRAWSYVGQTAISTAHFSVWRRWLAFGWSSGKRHRRSDCLASPRYSVQRLARPTIRLNSRSSRR
ncbi:MAG: tetratricopeptide repeat protein [Blastochloris sp.]|nr:tetratricopeptide repeat protein [Blastochloris sp.]